MFRNCFAIGLAIGLLGGPMLGADRVVSVGGSITEIVFALGAEKKLVGVDTTSVYPEATAGLQKIGYLRAMSAEGVLSLNPDLLLMSVEAGPPAAVQQLKEAGLSTVEIPEGHSLEGVREKIRKVSEVLKESNKGAELLKQFDAECAALAKFTHGKVNPPRVLFLMSMGSSMMASGKFTAANSMIELAGGKNVISEFERYRAVSPEALLASAPEVILVTQRTAEAAGGEEAVLKQHGLAETPAGKAGRIVVMDDMFLLGFGPRTALAGLELARKIYGD